MFVKAEFKFGIGDNYVLVVSVVVTGVVKLQANCFYPADQLRANYVLNVLNRDIRGVPNENNKT